LSERLGESKVTRRFQVTLPSKAREILDIKEGDFVVFYLNKKSEAIFLKAAKLVEK
jgi:AbrB family looped-hinge helix DNA binding protein